MRTYFVILALAATTLSGCMATPTERGLGGAVDQGAGVVEAQQKGAVEQEGARRRHLGSLRQRPSGRSPAIGKTVRHR